MPLDSRELHRPVKKLRKLLERLPRQPAPSVVHDLRTHARRLEAAASALSLKPGRDLARIRKRAGSVRDMDVLTALASRVRVAGEDACRQQLLEHLAARRKKYAKRLHAEVCKHAPRARSRLDKLQHQVDAHQADAVTAMAAALELETKLHDAGRLGRQNLHPFRLQVKALRNTLRLGRRTDVEVMRALDHAKDVIGAWHDWQMLLAVAAEVLTHGRRCTLLEELERRRERAYRSALTQAKRLRARYFDGGGMRGVSAAAKLSAR